MRIPIHTVRDLVVARNALRKNLAEQGISQPILHARVAAAVTAMAELILISGATGELTMEIIERDELTGIELDCEIRWLGGQLRSLTNVRKHQLNAAQSRLNRVTKDVECDATDAEHPNLIARIWPN